VYGDNDADVANIELGPSEKRDVMVIVPLTKDRTFRIKNTGSNTHVAVDLLGYFSPTAAGAYTAMAAPARILDTRAGVGAPAGALGKEGLAEIPVRGVGGIPAPATGLLVNVTTFESTASSHVDVSAEKPPNAHVTVEAMANRVRSDLALTGIGQANGSIWVRNDAGPTQVTVDVLGWFADGAGARYVPLPQSVPVLDTSTGNGAPRGTVAQGGTVSLQASNVAGVPQNATAAVLTLNGSGDGATSLSVGPQGRGWSGLASIDGIEAGRPVAGTVVPRLGPTGQIRIRNDNGSATVKAAVAGYFVGGPPLAEDNSSCAIDAEPGFTPLFDGRSPQSQRWRTTATGTPGKDGCETWTVSNQSTGWYDAENLPDAYTLRADWKASTENADSGVFIGFPNPTDDSTIPATRGLEVAIRPNGAGVTGTGAIFGLQAPHARAERPVGQWNTYDIAVSGKRVTVRLNDVVVNDYVIIDPNRIHGRTLVGIQGSDPNDLVRFRNIRLRVNQPAARVGLVTGVAGKCVDDADPGKNSARIVLHSCHGAPNQQFVLPGDGALHALGRCLDVSAVKNELGKPYVQLFDCNNTPPQQWVTLPNGTLQNPQSKACLDAPSEAEDVRLYANTDCHARGNQQWAMPTTQARYGLVAGVGDKCVDMAAPTPANNVPVVLHSCHGGSNQLVAVPGDGSIRVEGYCLDVFGQVANGRQNVQFYTCNGTAAQYWVNRPDGTLYNPVTNRCLDAPSREDVTPLYGGTCHGLVNQRWTLPALAPDGVLAPVPTPQLLASWTADENTGTALDDDAHNGHVATLQGNAGWGQGRRGSALSLDGAGAFAATPTPVLQTDRSFTVSAWVRVSKSDGAYTAVSQESGGRSSFVLQRSGDGHWAFAVLPAGAGDTYQAMSPEPAVTGQGTHLVGVYDWVAGAVRIYVDGQLKATHASNGTWQAAGPTVLGRARWDNIPVQFWPGQIDDVRLYQGVLSDAEIANLSRQ
jgi:hypothetical protein